MDRKTLQVFISLYENVVVKPQNCVQWSMQTGTYSHMHTHTHIHGISHTNTLMNVHMGTHTCICTTADLVLSLVETNSMDGVPTDFPQVAAEPGTFQFPLCRKFPSRFQSWNWLDSICITENLECAEKLRKTRAAGARSGKSCLNTFLTTDTIKVTLASQTWQTDFACDFPGWSCVSDREGIEVSSKLWEEKLLL